MLTVRPCASGELVAARYVGVRPAATASLPTSTRHVDAAVPVRAPSPRSAAASAALPRTCDRAAGRPVPCTNGSGNEPITAGTVGRSAQGWKSHHTRSPACSVTSVAPTRASSPFTKYVQSARRPRLPEMPSIDCTKRPP